MPCILNTAVNSLQTGHVPLTNDSVYQMQEWKLLIAVHS